MLNTRGCVCFRSKKKKRGIRKHVAHCQRLVPRSRARGDLLWDQRLVTRGERTRKRESAWLAQSVPSRSTRLPVSPILLSFPSLILLTLCYCATDDFSPFLADVCSDNPEVLFSCPAQGRKCVSRSFVCDGDLDCDKGEDEHYCDVDCDKNGMFRCKIGHPCIPNQWTCDGANDCVDGSDENVTLCGTTCNAPEKFLCSSGQCIASSSVCDGNRTVSTEWTRKNPIVTRPLHLRAI
eukprot:m.287138 g.287138  ORF g.287138 m.287138 type:complete len:236 (+) comp40702_c0_seq1:227-934(+)